MFRQHVAATLLAMMIVGIGVASLLSLFFNAPTLTHQAIVWHDIGLLVRLSAWQAFCSMFLSVFIAFTLVLSVLFLAQYPWFRRYFLPPWMALNSLLIVLPTTIAAQGLLLVWGRGGLFATLRESLDFSLFGLGGIVMAHMLLNIPLAFRVLWARLHMLPVAHQQLMLLINAPLWWRFRLLYLPHLLLSLKQASAMVFLLCFTSFSLVLIFGGGPAYNTLEVAIYTAIRFELDFARATLLSLVQWGLCLGFLWLSHSPLTPALAINSTVSSISALNRAGHALQWLSALVVLCLVFLFLVPPLLMVIKGGLNSAFFLWPSKAIFWQSMGYSLGLAIISSLLTLIVAFVLGYASLFVSSAMNRFYRQASNLFLMVPTVTFATGIFLLLRPFLFGTHQENWIAPVVLLLGNAFFSLPFVSRIITPALEQQHGRYAIPLALWSGHPWARWWYGYVLGLSLQWRLCFALAGTLSLGELGLIALFQTQHFTTLPWLIYQSISRFQLTEASALSLWLLLLMVLLYLISMLGKKNYA